ncbi:PepSY-associated TM helix domain-containing protein [Crenobacter luteus]|uniref:PepSY-associated TM helix domain-containing protein n=1 Tax=Crenobacter luteus TaxID=1452487 RepID=UPI00104328B6|nr:PepSY domain-containing protein [Crenobacter luteus]
MTPTPQSDGGRFYRLAWRWHFYAGLFVAPLLLMLSLTGIVYLFKPQLDAAMYRDLMFVAPAARTVSAETQLAAVRAAYPDARVVKFAPPPAADRASEVRLDSARAGKLTVFVDPYRNRVLGARDDERNLQTIALKLHGELLLGRAGDFVIEMATSWGLLLIASGVYLWWPRGQRHGVFRPRLTAKKRVFWRELHAVGGFWSLGLIGFLMLSGMPWTGFWGAQFAGVWNTYPAPLFREIPKSGLPAAALNSTSDKTVPWAVETTPLPASSDHHGHADHDAGRTRPALSLDAVVAIARARGLPAGYSVALPRGATGVYTVSANTDDPREQVTLHIDQYSGRVLSDIRWADYGAVARTVEVGIALHEGKLFGLANQLVMLFACLAAILLTVSGVVMWWKRRPAGRLGAPTTPDGQPIWRTGVAFLAVASLLFPAVGVSTLAVLAFDRLLLARLPPLARALR